MCAAAAIESLGLTKTRLEALSDGVFATLMTVLVLGLELAPQNPVGQPQLSLLQRLQPVLHPAFAYGLSFLVLGVYWVGHHNMFHYVRRTTRGFLWVNILFLMSVGIIPFSTTVIGEDLFNQTGIIFYAVNLTIASLFLFTIWWYSTRFQHLVQENLDTHLISSVDRRILMGPLIYLVAIGISFLAPPYGPITSIIMFVVALIYFILPGHVDIHFTRREHGHEND